MEQKTGNGIEALKGVTDNDVLNFINNLAKVDEKDAVAVLVENSTILGIIKCPEALQLALVKENGRLIKYFENPTEAVQFAAIKNVG